MAPPSASTSTSAASGSAKRKRVSRACDQCFQKKDRCDGVQPICTFCSQLGRSCTYERPERKRGPTQGLRPRLEQRICALETVLGFVLDQASQQGVTVDAGLLSGASEAQRKQWREGGWWQSDLRREVQRALALEDDLVTTVAAQSWAGGEVKPENANEGSNRVQEHEREGNKEEESDSDYSDVDLSLPASHQPNQLLEGAPTNGMPMLLSSGRGGSSLNRGLVPRGADPNAALGGFEIEFGGSERDVDWVNSFVPPTHGRNTKHTDKPSPSSNPSTNSHPH